MNNSNSVWHLGLYYMQGVDRKAKSWEEHSSIEHRFLYSSQLDARYMQHSTLYFHNVEGVQETRSLWHSTDS